MVIRWRNVTSTVIPHYGKLDIKNMNNVARLIKDFIFKFNLSLSVYIFTNSGRRFCKIGNFPMQSNPTHTSMPNTALQTTSLTRHKPHTFHVAR